MCPKRSAQRPSYALEPDRLQKVLNPTAHDHASLINEVRQEMNDIAAPSAREELRSDKLNKK
jgi:hypothetical protein